MRKIRRIVTRFTWIGFLALMLGTVPAYAGASAYLIGKRAIKEPSGAHGICARYDWACATTLSHANADAFQFDNRLMMRVRRVNSAINRSTRQISDASQYRQDELWALPTRRGGDCEDFALLKKRELIKLGIPAERLLIATVLDRNYRGHAVLVVRTHRGDMVLDNLTSRVMRWERTGYTFMKMQNPARPDTWQAILAGGLMADKGDKSTASTKR
jgi:predicted transglutaminase-like cysteine proteinase